MAAKKERGTGKELIKALNEICGEKGIEPEVIFEALEIGLVAAYKRNFASAQNVKVTINKVRNQNVSRETLVSANGEVCYAIIRRY